MYEVNVMEVTKNEKYSSKTGVVKKKTTGKELTIKELTELVATVTIATSKSQVSAIHNQLGENVGISVEPCRRDTFPAIALAAAYLKDVQHIGEQKIYGII